MRWMVALQSLSHHTTRAFTSTRPIGPHSGSFRVCLSSSLAKQVRPLTSVPSGSGALPTTKSTNSATTGKVASSFTFFAEQAVRSGTHLQAMLLQEHTGFKAVPTVLSKNELCREAGLELRDLRAIDPRFQHQHPVILVRKSSIVARLEKLKAIISPDQVLFFGYDNPSVQHLLPELRSKLANASQQIKEEQPGAMPLEFVTVSALLDFVCPRLETRFNKLDHQIMDEMEQMRHNARNTSLRIRRPKYIENALNMVPLKNELDLLSTDVEQVRRTVWDLLSSDEDMAAMYLTEKRALGTERAVSDHQEVEILLEGFARQLEETANNIQVLQRNIQNTEEFVSMASNAVRNALIRVEVLMNMFMVSLASGGTICALFGMNLVHSFEEHAYGFWIAAGGVVCVSSCTFGLIYYLTRKRLGHAIGSTIAGAPAKWTRA